MFLFWLFTFYWLSLIGSAVQQNRAQLLGFLNATVDAGNSALHVWREYVLYCWSFLSLAMLSNCGFVLESVTVLAHLMLNLWFSTPGLLLQQRDRLHNVLEHHHRHSQHGSVNSLCFLVFKPQCFLQELQIVCVCVCVCVCVVLMLFLISTTQRNTISWASALWARATKEEMEVSTLAPSWRGGLWLQMDALNLVTCCCRWGGSTP